MENLEKPKLKYTKVFTDLVKSSVNENIYIGIGNPNAKILFVGKEANSKGKDGYAEEWEKLINDSICQNLFNNNPLSSGHTWRKYQKLYDYIFERKYENKDKKINIDFLENVFTTEMGAIPSKRTKEAQQNPYFKKELDKRKTFFQSEYINQFPVIVLACGNYIGYYNKINQIEDTFGVSFAKEYPLLKTNSKAQRFWTHFNKDKPKLVIHTRQLSGSVSDELLKGIALQIREFKEKNPHCFEKEIFV